MHRGHSPEAIDDYAWRDVEAYLAVYPDLITPFGG